MSQRPSASRPASRSPTDGQNISLPPAQFRDDAQQPGRQAGGRDMQQEPEMQSTVPATQHPEPPNIAQASRGMLSGEDRKTSGSRGLGVHTILNPAEPELSRSSTPRPGGGITQSPQSIGPTSQYATNPSTFSAQGYGSQQTTSSSIPEEDYGSTSSGPRKILIPKSPRAVSLGGRPTATISATQAPFLSPRGRIYTAEPGSGPSSEVPPMPTPTGPPQRPYSVPSTAATPSLTRRASMATMSAPARTPLSQSVSPSPSIRSTYSQPSQPSPAPAPAPRHQLGQPPQSGPYYPGSSFGAPQQGEGSSQAGPPGTEGPYMTSLPESMFHRASQSGGQNPNIRFMPISTEHGQLYVPVDVQAASKMADEKRARNAGASARFRERRKQKEREAADNIQKLEQQLRDFERRLREAEQDRDFYRSERDRFRDIVYRTPATTELAMQVPPSPRLARAASFPPPPPGPTYRAPEFGTPEEVERSSRRRRIGASGEHTYLVPPPTSLPSFQGPSYGPGHGPGVGQPSTSLPPLRNVTSPGTGDMTAPSNTPLTTRPPSFEQQYPRGGYGRGWPRDGGGQRQ